MKAVLRCDLTEDGKPWDTSMLGSSVSGLPLLRRHLLGFREAGVTEVEIRVLKEDKEVSRILEACRVPGLETRISSDLATAHNAERLFQQRADTLIDPRLLQQAAKMAKSEVDASWGGSLSFVDRHRDNYAVEVKSPYHVRVSGKEEAKVLGESPPANGFYPIGLEVRDPSSKQMNLVDVGLFYWHRFRSSSDFKAATRKVLLATMKMTDGIYARTNRRVSLRISRLLAPTSVTPNMVTVFTLFCSLFSGLLYAQGTYWFMVAGAFVSWAASMLDGVDGELARSKFQTSDFGCWLEMVCDYLYYVFVFTGMGWGLTASSGNPIWLYLGLASAAGSIISFAVVAHQRRLYSAEGDAGEYGTAFQQKVGSHGKTSPVSAIARKLTFLATRAAAPYYILIFTVLGLTKLLLGLIFFGTTVACLLAASVTRLFRSPAAD